MVQVSTQKYLHFYGQNKMSKNREIKGNLSTKLSFPQLMISAPQSKNGVYDIFAILGFFLGMILCIMFYEIVKTIFQKYF